MQSRLTLQTQCTDKLSLCSKVHVINQTQQTDDHDGGGGEDVCMARQCMPVAVAIQRCMHGTAVHFDDDVENVCRARQYMTIMMMTLTMMMKSMQGPAVHVNDGQMVMLDPKTLKKRMNQCMIE